jgi:hypothetical protein
LDGQGLVGLCAISKETTSTVLADGGKDPTGRFDLLIDAPTGYVPAAVMCTALNDKAPQIFIFIFLI